jgi:hypothetical protein
MSLRLSNVSSSRNQQNAPVTVVKKSSSAFKKSNSSISSNNLLNYSNAKSASERVHFKTNNRDNEIKDYNKILDVRKAIDKMNFIYPETPSHAEELNKRKQRKIVKSTSSTHLQQQQKQDHQQKNAANRLSKSARVNNNYIEETYSLRPSNESASKISFKPPSSDIQQPIKQSSINTILCQKCLQLHLDRCSLCFNDSNLDSNLSENDYYYYKTAIESSGE